MIIFSLQFSHSNNVHRSCNSKRETFRIYKHKHIFLLLLLLLLLLIFFFLIWNSVFPMQVIYWHMWQNAATTFPIMICIKCNYSRTGIYLHIKSTGKKIKQKSNRKEMNCKSKRLKKRLQNNVHHLHNNCNPCDCNAMHIYLQSQFSIRIENCVLCKLINKITSSMDVTRRLQNQMPMCISYTYTPHYTDADIYFCCNGIRKW